MSRRIVLAFVCFATASLTSFGADTTPPSIAGVSPPAGAVSALTQISVTFSEPVTGLQRGDLLVNGVPAENVNGINAVYTFTFAQPPYGPVLISWSDQHAIMDLAQPPNRFDHTAPSSTWQYDLLDQIAPSITSLFPPSGATLRSLAEVQVTFSEDVAGVDAADLRMNGQPATNVFKVGSGPFVFQFPPAATGPVTMSWASNPGIVDFGVPPNAFTPVGWSYQVDPNTPRPDVVITEILAANQNGIVDEDGDEEGWIEIYNRGTNVANLANWSLSDDPEEPGLWVFPSGTIAPGGYMVVFASGKDRRNPVSTNRFHTSFRLANGGEFLGLYGPDSPRSLVTGFTPEYPEQRNDYSYGYDTNGALRYFSIATPGARNGGTTILSITEPVRFSVERGFYSSAFDLYLSSPTLGATIRYTLDGLEPTASTGIGYTGPLRITNTTVIRAVAFRPNFLPSIVRTHSYLFNFTAAQRALPVINLTMTTSNWFGRSGILGMGGGSRATDGLFITNNPTTDYHNPSAHGIAWERPLSAEYISPIDNSGFQIDCGIRVQGSDWQRPRTTLDSKFSYRLYFRGDYGQGKLNFPLFPLGSVQSFDQIVLRAGFNEQINPFIRDEIIRRMSQDMGQVSAQGTLALVLRNGGPYTNSSGVIPAYNPCERINESFMQSHFGGNARWDVVGPDFAISSEGLGIIDGDRIDFRNLLTNVWTGSAVRPITTPAQYQAMSRRLDLVNFVDYCLLNAYTAMGDWPANNWRAGRERSTNGIWRFFVWDAEWGMGIYTLPITRDSFIYDRTGTEDAGLGSVVNSEIARLYQGLRANPEFRLLWADRIQKHFFNGGALSGLNISNRFNELRAQLEPAFTPAQAMDTEILVWARDRFPIIMGQFHTNGLYGYSNGVYGVFASSNAPAFNQHGGRVAAGFGLTMTAPQGGTIYYTTNGRDPRVPFSGAVSNAAVAYTGPVTLNQSMVVKARALLGTNWSALNEAEFKVESLIPTLRITEIMYNPIGGNAYEFLELENYGATPVNLSGMSFDGITFRFPNPTTLAAGAKVLLASGASPSAFAARYPNVTVGGYFSGALNNGGERIALLDALGNTILSVAYGNSGLWPVAANGAGYSLVLTDPAGDPDNALSWRASIAQGGSPGSSEQFPNEPPAVTISEISAASSAQWIELYNPTAGGIDLAGYSLTDDGQARKFVLPSSVIPAGGYMTVDPTNFFTLNAHGDEVLLYDQQTNLISRVAFGLQAAGYTLSRVNGDWTLGTPTPNAANIAASLGSANALVINEWLANPITGSDDWLELWNNSAQPVSLQGVYVGVSNALFRISSRSFIGPYGFAQLFADENPGADHLDLRLPAVGGRIIVNDNAGVEVTRVNYGAQTENVSQGRLPDGSATIQSFAGSASPGASNYVISYNGPYLNEVMARNVSAVTNSDGRVADWVEIYNPGVSEVDLSGMSLSVDAPEPFQWVFPAGSLIPAGGFLVVWCDGDAPASTSFGATLNCGHSLNGDGGGVYLYSAAGQLVNFVEYGLQLPNQTIGLQSGQWRLLLSFTPGAGNAIAIGLGGVTTLSFNEWMADPVTGDDWFELYNSGSLAVSLAGLVLTDDSSLAGQNKFRIPALSFIGAKGWVRFIADSDPGKGFNHVNFSLDASGESLRLYNPPTTTPIASVYFGPQATGISEGRLPDGATAITRFPGSATPGESNYQLPENVTINEVLASSNQIELYNPSSQAANVGGWYLSNSRADYKLFRIPDGTAVPAGGYLVLTPSGFTLNTALGGEVILSAADVAGNLTGLGVHAPFGPQAAGVSFGRFATSQGVQFVALAQPTLGAANSGALVGPVVINEIMYNPPTDSAEFIELQNISSSPQSLLGWTLANAVHGSLPAISLQPGEFLVVEILPENGRLDNAGERIDLLNAAGVLIDFVDYGDSTPWPSGDVDGGGLSLQRRNSAQFGNDPLNWLASAPTPGAPNGSGAVALPVITATPQSQSVLVDATPVLAVDASGGAPLAYQWRFNGLKIAGATSRELALDFVQLEQTGTYDVLVSNPAGTAISSPATVFVQSAPIIVVAPQSQTIATNTGATFFVVVRASAPVTYQWRFNGTSIPGATTTSYSVSNAALQHIGDYSVLVSNPLGNAIASAYLAVLVPPIFTLQPVTQTVAEGEDATFRSAVIGLTPFSFRWRRPGVSAITNGIGYDTAIITLTNVPMSYSNNTIDVIASNAARPAPGGVQSRQGVRLFVLPDADHDKLPDTWENANGLNMNDPSDAAADKDGDGISNRDEYLAGTDPNDPNSFLRVTLVSANLNTPAVLLSFNAASNKTYTVQYRDNLGGAVWSKLLDVESDVTNRLMQVTDTSPNAASRFYKLVTPATR